MGAAGWQFSRAQPICRPLMKKTVASLKSCSPEEKEEAKATCGKHLGSRPEEIRKGLLFAKIFEDCVFDICAGEGESAAQLAAAYMQGFF